MAEYWYIREGFEEKADTFLATGPQPVVTMDYSIGQHDFINAGKASGEIKLALKKIGVDSVILRRVAIAAYEAEINVTAHARGGTIQANIFPDCIQILFVDKGPGIDDIDQCMVPGYSTATDYVREMGFGAGLGLPNIKRNTDVLHIVSTPGDHTELEIVIYYG
jgi:anti-sigma regulatory factor (Ser/Thr protein kinase)